jgi:hypothetical protein
VDDRRKTLEAFVKQLRSGNANSDDFIDTDKKLLSQALDARNLTEDALANEVLKNTGVPIPNDNAPRLKKEDFLNRIVKERYPEFEPDLKYNRFLENDLGVYNPTDGGILINDKKGNILSQVGTSLHEAGHKYDDKVVGFDGTETFKKTITPSELPSGKSLKDLDSMQLNELIHKGHHARLPDLRNGDAYGLGALKSYLKSGKFKQMAGAVPVVGSAVAAGAALMSPDASAAVGDALVPGGLESLGPSEDDAAIENPQATPELRRQALERLKNGR